MSNTATNSKADNPKEALRISKVPDPNRNKLTLANKPLEQSGAPGVRFFHLLKNLGYEPSKHVKAEHFEYLFLDSKNQIFFKALSKIAKRENVLGKEEVEGYEALKNKGLALYGIDLEQAVDRKAALDKQRVAEDNKKSSTKAELRRLIALRKSELKEIQDKNDVISRMAKEKIRRSADSRAIAIAGQFQRESQTLDIEIQVSQRRLKDKILKLQNFDKTLLQNAGEPNKKLGNVLKVDDWEEFLKDEETLITEVESLMHDHAPNLILDAEGYGDEGEQKMEEIRKILTEHVGNFERLRHNIIYESVRQAELMVKLSQVKAANGMTQQNRTSKPPADWRTQQKLEKELEARIYTLEEEYGRVYVDATEIVRQVSVQEVDEFFQPVIETKIGAKRRLGFFFSRVYCILKLQKIRLDVLRSVIMAEDSNYRHLNSKLTELCRRSDLLNLNSTVLVDFNPRSMSMEGRVLCEIFSQLGIPLTVLKSTSKTLDVLNTNYNEILCQNTYNDMKKEDTEYNQTLKKLVDQRKQLHEIFENHLSPNSQERELIKQLEIAQADAQTRLNSIQENKPARVKESIANKQALLERMKAALAKY